MFVKKLHRIAVAAIFVAIAFIGRAEKYQYQTVPNDPLNTKIYTLPNGLKVFMSVNKDEPRIQTYIAVKVGSKNDPAVTTGLAHYFEHLMFKGTRQFGTQNYEAEKPMLDKIEDLFEVYRVTTDSAERKALYHQIDSISYEASKIAIPNEYDKLMAAIGATGSNAYTSNDQTVYVENIPSNEIENWAMIQADRFENPVIRGFHTELETIYEEKNMSLTSDGDKVVTRLMELLFPHHPYGTQTTLGTQEHLKNPSIRNVRKYHEQWYVPNNIAICLSGDFNPDEMVDAITKYFGHMKPNPELPVLKYDVEAPITSPIKSEVVGNDAESLYLGWRFPGASSRDIEILTVIDRLLNNGSAGLIDLNIIQQQKALQAGNTIFDAADYSGFIVYGAPNAGQSLDDLRDILVEQVVKVGKGEFTEEMVQAVISNLKLDQQRLLEDNESRADIYVNAFINGQDLADYMGRMDRIERITRKDVMDFASKYLTDKNYVAVYKLQGKDSTEVKMPKPELTPIATNRHLSSKFLQDVQNSEVAPIEPRFLDYKKDVNISEARNGIPFYYSHNVTNDIFRLVFLYDFGEKSDRLLGYAFDYLDLLGTKDMTPEQIKNEFYRLASTYSVSSSDERTFVTLSGLSENMPKALALLEKLIAEVMPDAEVYANYVEQVEKNRQDMKADQRSNFSMLTAYVQYGKDNVSRINEETSIENLRKLSPSVFTDKVKALRNYPHTILYYGPLSQEQALKEINDTHYVPAEWAKLPENKEYRPAEPKETVFYIAPYDAKQVQMTQFTSEGKTFDSSIEPLRRVYNLYFGNGMNSIVFQDMRESRSLAYSAVAYVGTPMKKDDPYTFTTFIATQNDKLLDAVNAFNEIINDMPLSEGAFKLAKDNLESQLRTTRYVKDDAAWNYLTAKYRGLDHDINADVFEALQNMTLEDVVKYQENNIKGRTYYYSILGDPDDLDLEALRKLGRVELLTTEEIFGY